MIPLLGGAQVQFQAGLGGIGVQGQVSAGANAYVHGNVAHINEIFHVQNHSYVVIAESTQVVAGTNHFLHLLGQSDNQQYQITVFVGLDGNARITEVANGHLQLQHGFGLSV